MSLYHIKFLDEKGLNILPATKNQPESMRDKLERCIWNGEIYQQEMKQYKVISLRISIKPGDDGVKEIDATLKFLGYDPSSYDD